MSALVPCCAPPAWTGLIQSTSLLLLLYASHMCHRIKDKLQSGEMAVSGDQWPLFLYQEYRYDADDPWNGLFRSSILVSVRASE
jgi:hypothetical protein